MRLYISIRFSNRKVVLLEPYTTNNYIKKQNITCLHLFIETRRSQCTVKFVGSVFRIEKRKSCLQTSSYEIFPFHDKSKAELLFRQSNEREAFQQNHIQIPQTHTRQFTAAVMSKIVSGKSNHIEKVIY